MEQLSKVNQPNMSWSDPDSWVHSCERSVVSCEISFCKKSCFCVCCKAETTGILQAARLSLEPLRLSSQD